MPRGGQQAREALKQAQANRYGDGMATRHGLYAAQPEQARLACAAQCPWASECAVAPERPADFVPGCGPCWRLPELHAAIVADVAGLPWIKPEQRVLVSAYAGMALRCLMAHLYLLQVYREQGSEAWATALGRLHRAVAHAETQLQRAAQELLLTPSARTRGGLALLDDYQPHAQIARATRALAVPDLRPAALGYVREGADLQSECGASRSQDQDERPAPTGRQHTSPKCNPGGR